MVRASRGLEDQGEEGETPCRCMRPLSAKPWPAASAQQCRESEDRLGNTGAQVRNQHPALLPQRRQLWASAGTSGASCPDHLSSSSPCALTFRSHYQHLPALPTNKLQHMPTELPYAADAEEALNYDDLEVRKLFTVLSCGNHAACRARGMGRER